MRNIKFRFVDETGTIYGPMRLIDLIEEARYCTKHENAPFIKAKDGDYLTLKEFCRDFARGQITAEQFIESRNIQGNEIYEGDILYNEANEWNWALVFEDSRFLLKPAIGENKVGVVKIISGSSIKYLKLVGNIHESPELVGGKK